MQFFHHNRPNHSILLMPARLGNERLPKNKVRVLSCDADGRLFTQLLGRSVYDRVRRETRQMEMSQRNFATVYLNTDLNRFMPLFVETGVKEAWALDRILEHALKRGVVPDVLKPYPKEIIKLGEMRYKGLSTGETKRTIKKTLESSSKVLNRLPYYEKQDIGIFNLGVPGEHNVLNSMAAILTALDIGLAPDIIRTSICAYKGAERRFQEKACIDDIMVIDDYAHHPTEITATLKVALNMKRKRLISIFQPHRFTRTKFLKKEFAHSFISTDYLILTDIYPANEKPIFGITSMCIYDEALKIKKMNVNYIAKEKLLKYLADFAKPGDTLLFLGAGDIGRLSGEFVLLLKRRTQNEQETSAI